MLLQSSTQVSGSGPRGRSLLAAGGLLAAAVFAGGVGLRAQAADDKKTEEKKDIVVLSADGGGKPVVLRSGDTDQDAKKYRVTVNVVDDDDKDTEKGEKKTETKKKQMRIVIDTGDGPVVIPFDGKTDNIGEKVQEAVRKARAKADVDQNVREKMIRLRKIELDKAEKAVADRDRERATEKALELLKGELDEQQLRQLKKHLEEVRARARADAEKARADGDKARAEAKKAQVEAEKAARMAAEKFHEALKQQGADNEDLHKHLQEHIQQAIKQGMAGVHEGEFKAFAGPQAFTFAIGGGRLGVQLKKPSADLADQLDLPKDQGLVIVEVQKGSAAAKAGLKANDILLEVDGKAVTSDVGGLIKRLQEVKGDGEIVVVVLRKGHKEKIGGIKLPEAKKDGAMLWKQIKPEDGVKFGVIGIAPHQADGGAKFEGKVIEVTPEIKVIPDGGRQIRVAPKIKAGKADKDEEKEEHKSEKNEKSERKVNRTVSVTVNNGKLTAEQKEGDVTITVTGAVDGEKVEVERIVINDGGEKKSYKGVGAVPEKHREAVKRLISNTRGAPVQFEFKRSEKKSDE